MTSMYTHSKYTLVWTLMLLPSIGICDNRLHHNGIDKVYHPYVQPLEREIEIRGTYQLDDSEQEDHLIKQRVGLGASVNEFIFLEAYLIGQRPSGEGFDLTAYEIEAKFQLTEQGEYWSDWGVLVEIGRERSESITELAAGILWAKEWGQWTSTINFLIENEFGSDIDNEIETELALQLKYRLSEKFEPTLEFYSDEFTDGVGPTFMGLLRLGQGKKVRWELGLIKGLNADTPDQTIKALLEYEF